MLKAGATLAVAPFVAGMGAAARPTEARAGNHAGTGKNVLVVSASPRKGGNSELLCGAFMLGATEAGHVAHKVRLSKQDINYCTGCLDCIGGRGNCSQSDDMDAISGMVLAADVIVLASPVYFMSFNGQMKTFIDRLCPIYTRINGKEFYFVLSAAGGRSSIDSAVRNLRVFTGCLRGNEEKGILASIGFWDPGKVKGTPHMSEAYALGRNV